MNELNKISVFRNYFDTNPALTLSVYEFCVNVQNGDYAKEVIQIRSEPNKEQRDAIKATLPAVTISGVFNKRKKEQLIKHSGFICLDIDSHHNSNITDWEALRNTLSTWKEIYFSALSVSGKGVFLIIPISNPEQHENHYKALEKDFLNIGITIDTACKDVSRLRGMSYDKNAMINDNAISYKRIYSPPAPKKIRTNTNTSIKIDSVKKWVEKKASFIKGSRHEYISLFAGACNRFGIPEHETRSELLSYQQEGFEAKEIESIIQYMYSDINYHNTISNE